MIQIDELKCTGCGMCVRDCLNDHIAIFERKAKVMDEGCISCGHCVAVCPAGAVSINEYDMSEVVKLKKQDMVMNPDKLLQFMKARRSIRRFTEEPIEDKTVQMILESGRYTPTGGNAQTTKFIVLRNNISKVRETALKSLYQAAKEDQSGKMPYREKFIKNYHDYEEEGEDGLFYHGKLVIVILDKKQGNMVNGSLAASRMELMANALGLGACFIGFLGRAAAVSEELVHMLEIPEEYGIATTLTLGYPAIKYQRTVPRKETDVTWM